MGGIFGRGVSESDQVQDARALLLTVVAKRDPLAVNCLTGSISALNGASHARPSRKTIGSVHFEEDLPTGGASSTDNLHAYPPAKTADALVSYKELKASLENFDGYSMADLVKAELHLAKSDVVTPLENSMPALDKLYDSGGLSESTGSTTLSDPQMDQLTSPRQQATESGMLSPLMPIAVSAPVAQAPGGALLPRDARIGAAPPVSTTVSRQPSLDSVSASQKGVPVIGSTSRAPELVESSSCTTDAPSSAVPLRQFVRSARQSWNPTEQVLTPRSSSVGAIRSDSVPRSSSQVGRAAPGTLAATAQANPPTQIIDTSYGAAAPRVPDLKSEISAGLIRHPCQTSVDLAQAPAPTQISNSSGAMPRLRQISSSSGAMPRLRQISSSSAVVRQVSGSSVQSVMAPQFQQAEASSPRRHMPYPSSGQSTPTSSLAPPVILSAPPTLIRPPTAVQQMNCQHGLVVPALRQSLDLRSPPSAGSTPAATPPPTPPIAYLSGQLPRQALTALTPLPLSAVATSPRMDAAAGAGSPWLHTGLATAPVPRTTAVFPARSVSIGSDGQMTPRSVLEGVSSLGGLSSLGGAGSPRTMPPPMFTISGSAMQPMADSRRSPSPECLRQPVMANTAPSLVPIRQPQQLRNVGMAVRAAYRAANTSRNGGYPIEPAANASKVPMTKIPQLSQLSGVPKQAKADWR
eukprot:TRINITY_DN92669_c0_g1_i1.p1 TRINITY_DN92669_c0_g1~~TRINITY_DN92669_c0_g1_i1.p1  ORF type:complete len:716 (+),score=75.14 TRINITY_DN92669_c0_g1_i1:75-2150(+)